MRSAAEGGDLGEKRVEPAGQLRGIHRTIILSCTSGRRLKVAGEHINDWRAPLCCPGELAHEDHRPDDNGQGSCQTQGNRMKLRGRQKPAPEDGAAA